MEDIVIPRGDAAGADVETRHVEVSLNYRIWSRHADSHESVFAELKSQGKENIFPSDGALQSGGMFFFRKTLPSECAIHDLPPLRSTIFAPHGLAERIFFINARSEKSVGPPVHIQCVGVREVIIPFRGPGR